MIQAAKTKPYLQFFLAGMSLVFVLVIIFDLNRKYDLNVVEELDVQIAKKKEQSSTANEVTPAKPINDYDQIIERPLFMQDRRPYVAEEIVGAPQKTGRQKPVARIAQDEYILSAVIITNDKRIALLQSKKNKKLQKLNQGDELDGWTLTDIQPAQVSLKKGTEIKQLELTVKGSPQQAPTKRKKDAKAAQMRETIPPPPDAAMKEENTPGVEPAAKKDNQPDNAAK